MRDIATTKCQRTRDLVNLVEDMQEAFGLLSGWASGGIGWKYAELGGNRMDKGRCPGKTPKQLAEIIRAGLQRLREEM